MFGCLYFSHVPQVKRNKLEKKSESGIFVGCSFSSKANKVYQPQIGNIIVSKDMFFNDDENWDCAQTKNTSSSKQKSSTLFQTIEKHVSE